MAVSVEALVFIVIGRESSEGCGFDSHFQPGSFLKFNYRPIVYGMVGSLILSWSWTRQPGFISRDESDISKCRSPVVRFMFIIMTYNQSGGTVFWCTNNSELY